MLLSEFGNKIPAIDPSASFFIFSGRAVNFSRRDSELPRAFDLSMREKIK